MQAARLSQDAHQADAAGAGSLPAPHSDRSLNGSERIPHNSRKKTVAIAPDAAAEAMEWFEVVRTCRLVAVTPAVCALRPRKVCDAVGNGVFKAARLQGRRCRRGSVCRDTP